MTLLWESRGLGVLGWKSFQWSASSLTTNPSSEIWWLWLCVQENTALLPLGICQSWLWLTPKIQPRNWLTTSFQFKPPPALAFQDPYLGESDIQKHELSLGIVAKGEDRLLKTWRHQLSELETGEAGVLSPFWETISVKLDKKKSNNKTLVSFLLASILHCNSWELT